MSLFYDNLFTYRFPVPLLAFERLSKLSPEDPVAAIAQVLSEVCGISDPSEDDISYFLTRHDERAQEKPKDKEPDSDDRKLVTRGTSFQQFMVKQDSAKLLLMACEWDFAKANFWYSKADADAAEQVIETFVALQSENNLYMYEAALYAFGGKYKDSFIEDEIDGTELSVEEIMALQFH